MQVNISFTQLCICFSNWNQFIRSLSWMSAIPTDSLPFSAKLGLWLLQLFCKLGLWLLQLFCKTRAVAPSTLLQNSGCGSFNSSAKLGLWFLQLFCKTRAVVPSTLLQFSAGGSFNSSAKLGRLFRVFELFYKNHKLVRLAY